MRHSFPLSIALLVCPIAQAETTAFQRQPVVVHEGHNTIPTQRYFKRLKREGITESPVVPPTDAQGVLPLEQRLPLSTSRLQVGPPQMKAILGLVTPIFVMGMDDLSLNWFDRAADGLIEIGARGMVVEASRLTDWQTLKEKARNAGIDLMLLEGDALAEGYGISTYPIVLMSPELTQQGFRE